MAYRALDSAQIIATLQQLVRRIEERFPGAGLAAVARELLALSSFCATASAEHRPATLTRLDRRFFGWWDRSLFWQWRGACRQ